MPGAFLSNGLQASEYINSCEQLGST